jgi:hypothetical protein
MLLPYAETGRMPTYCIHTYMGGHSLVVVRAGRRIIAYSLVDACVVVNLAKTKVIKNCRSVH